MSSDTAGQIAYLARVLKAPALRDSAAAFPARKTIEDSDSGHQRSDSYRLKNRDPGRIPAPRDHGENQ